MSNYYQFWCDGVVQFVTTYGMGNSKSLEVKICELLNTVDWDIFSVKNFCGV